MEVLRLLNDLCQNVIEQCAEKRESALGTCIQFCRKWLPDPQNFLDNDGIISNFYELNQFLLSEVFSWSQCELFARINADVTDVNSPVLTCLASFLSLAAAMRCEKANGSGHFSNTFSAVVFEDENHRVSFNYLLLNICQCKSTTHFCQSVFFKTILSGEVEFEEEEEANEEDTTDHNGQTQEMMPDYVDIQQKKQTCVTSPEGLSNETIGSLNMSKMDLNKSSNNLFASDNQRSCAGQRDNTSENTPKVTVKRISRLLSRLSSGGGSTCGSDTERSFVFNNSGDKTFYGDVDSPFAAAGTKGVIVTHGIITSAVPPLRNPKLSVSSPYSKLAQKNATIAKRFHLMTLENEDLKDENCSLKKQIESLQQVIDTSKEQMVVQNRKLMDLTDENEVVRSCYHKTEKQLSSELMKLEKLEVENRGFEKDNKILSLEVEQTNKRVKDLLTEKSVWEKRERELLSRLKEDAKYLESQNDTWAKREEMLNNKIHELKQAHDFLAARRSELQTELNSLKDEKLELEADLTSKFTKEVCSLELRLKNSHDELDQLKLTNESQCRSLSNQNEELSRLRLDKAQLEEEVRLLRDTAETTSDDFRSAKESLQQQVDQLFELRNTSEQTCAELRAKLKQIQGELKISDEKHQEMLKHELDEAESKFRQMKSELSSEVERLKAESCSKTEQIVQMELKEKLNLTNMSNLELKLSRANEDLEAERKSSCLKFSELDKESQEKEETIAALNDQLATLKSTSETTIMEKDQMFSMEKQKWEHTAETHVLEIEKKNGIISQLNEKVITVTREMNDYKLEKDRQHHNDVTALRGERDLSEEENAKMAKKIEMLQQEVARVKGDKTLVHKGLVDRLETEVASLRNKVKVQNEQMAEKESQLSILKNEMVQLEESVHGYEKTVDQLRNELGENRKKFDSEMQVTKQKSAELSEQLNFQINILSEEKDIMQSSLEMENKNLTDNILQLESERESLSEEKQSLKKETTDLANRCHQWKASYDALMLQNTNTEEAYQDVKNQLEVSEERFTIVEKEKTVLQDRVNETGLEIEHLRCRLNEIDSLKEQVASLETRLKYADETTNSFKRLYKLEKDKNLKLSEGHTLTSTHRKHSINIKQEASAEDEMTKQAAAVVSSRLLSKLDAPAVPRKTISASDLQQLPKYSLRRSGPAGDISSKPPPMPPSLRGSVSSNICKVAPTLLQSTSMEQEEEEQQLPPVAVSGSTSSSSTRSLRNKASASLQFAYSVPDESFFSSQEIVKIMQEEHLPKSRIEDLVRYPLRTEPPLPSDAITGSVSSIDSNSSASSSDLSTRRGSNTSHNFSSSVSAPQLPGAVTELPPPPSTSSRDIRRVPIVGDITTGLELDRRRGGRAGLFASFSSLSSTAKTGDAISASRYDNQLNSAQSVDSVITSSSSDASGTDGSNRWSEIERRNSMYPKHLQSSYPTEEITTSTSSSSINEQSQPNRENVSSTRKRTKSIERESSNKDKHQVMCPEMTSLANIVKQKPLTSSKNTPRKSSRLSSSLLSLSASKKAKKENIQPPVPGAGMMTSSAGGGAGGLAGSVIGALSMPSPQKLFHKVTRGRRSNLVEPLTTVPETSVTSSSLSSNQHTAVGAAAPSVLMEFPNTPPVAKKTKRRAPFGVV